MSIDRSGEGSFRAELTSLVGRARRSSDDVVREDLFLALSMLERKALIGGASDATLREIAEARFLTGILRDAVRPARVGSLRTVLRAQGAARSAPRGEARRRNDVCRGQA